MPKRKGRRQGELAAIDKRRRQLRARPSSCGIARFGYSPWASATTHPLRIKRRWPRSHAGWPSSSHRRTSCWDERALRPSGRERLHHAARSPGPTSWHHARGKLCMARPTARIEQLEELMRNDEVSTTAVCTYQNARDLEATVVHNFARAPLAADAERRRADARSGS